MYFQNIKSALLWFYLIALTVLISACGGSGGGGDDDDDGGEDPGTLVVDSTTPSNGETLEAFPDEISVEFNRDLLLSSVSPDQFTLTASGDDGTFGDGNEADITIDGASTTGTTVSLDVSTAAATAADDTYQLTIVSEDASAIADNDGGLLDGDANDTEGGNYVGTFVVETPPPPPEPTLTEIQTSILTPNCATSGCHDASTESAGLLLTAGSTFAETVGVDAQQDSTLNLNRIEPGEPDNSYLVLKIEGAPGITNERMPRFQAPLSAEDIQLIRDWVTAGALDN